LGHALRSVACRHPGALCERCDSTEDCAYSWLFEAGRAENAPDRFDRPVPYVLRPPLGNRECFHPGDELELRLTLVGCARDWLATVAGALGRIRHLGLGRRQSRWRLSALAAVEPQGMRPILDPETFTGDRPREWDGNALATACPASPFRMEFLTPTLLETKGECPELTASMICKRLLRRMAGLAERYCGWCDTSFDFQSLVRAAERIRCENQQLVEVDFERCSTRQHRRIPLTGFVGQITLFGVPVELRPYFAVGQWLHIGRRASFGLGAYRLTPFTQDKTGG
jgi:hypothetical protein